MYNLYVVVKMNHIDYDSRTKWLEQWEEKPEVSYVKDIAESYADFHPKYNGDSKVIGWELRKEEALAKGDIE